MSFQASKNYFAEVSPNVANMFGVRGGEGSAARLVGRVPKGAAGAAAAANKTYKENTSNANYQEALYGASKLFGNNNERRQRRHTRRQRKNRRNTRRRR
jgi:hypothetical protein